MRMWDESRNAVNTIEMYQTNNWLVRTFHFTPETYELKPPLLTWCQVGSLHLFGVNELGIRFPSVLFSLITLALLLLLVYKMTSSWWASIVAVLVAATSAGFYGEHVGRYGDHDALLVMLCTATLVCVYGYATTKKNTYIYLTAIAIMLGVFAKSIAIMMIFPGIALWLFTDKKALGLLRSPHFYLAGVLAAIPVAAYYLSREKLQPGYLDLVWQNELFPRFFNTSTDLTFNEYSFWYYFQLLAAEKMRHWSWLLPLVLIIPFAVKKIDRRWTFWVVQALVFLLIISSGSKNFWYLAPAIPMLSGAIAVSAFLFLKKETKLTWLILVPLLVAGIASYKQAYRYAFHISERYYEWETNGISHLLRDKERAAQLPSSTTILLDDAYGLEPHMFYVKHLQMEREIPLKRTFMNQLQPNDTILISHQSVYENLQREYDVQVLDSMYLHVRLVRLNTTLEDSSDTLAPL